MEEEEEEADVPAATAASERDAPAAAAAGAVVSNAYGRRPLRRFKAKLLQRCGKESGDSRFKYAAKTQTHVVSAVGRLKIPFRKAIKELALKSAPVLEEVNRFITYRILEILDELHGNDVHQAAVFEKLSGLYANDKVIKALV